MIWPENHRSGKASGVIQVTLMGPRTNANVPEQTEKAVSAPEESFSPPFLCPFALFRLPTRLDDAYPHLRAPFALLSPSVQMLVPSENTLTDTRKNVLPAAWGTPCPSKADTIMGSTFVNLAPVCFSLNQC